MDCSNQNAYNWTIAVGALLASAVALCVVAGILNASFFGAPGAPAVMGIVFAITTLAGVFMGLARSSFGTYEACVSKSGCHEKCASIFRQARMALNGAIAGISAAAALITAAIVVSWIPWGGTVSIGIALIGILVASVTVIIAIGYMVGAVNCINACLD